MLESVRDIRLPIKIILVSLLLSFGTGCAFRDMHPQLHVTEGHDPEYENVGVLFHNIYYYRVFEYCPGPNDSREITKDNLFRFKMTGKAYSLLFTKVSFEAGIMKKHQIDPFGTKIHRNKKTGRFDYSGSDYVDAEKRETRLEQLNKELDTILKYVEKNKKFNNQSASSGSSDTTALNQKKVYDEIIQKRLDELNKAMSNEMKKVYEAPAETECSNHTPANREFWILGPEGWRRFNRDDRLVLAMSITGDPILGPLKELSARVLNKPLTHRKDLDTEKERVEEGTNILDKLNIDSTQIKSSIEKAKSVINDLTTILDENNEPKLATEVKAISNTIKVANESINSDEIKSRDNLNSALGKLISPLNEGIAKLNRLDLDTSGNAKSKRDSFTTTLANTQETLTKMKPENQQIAAVDNLIKTLKGEGNNDEN